MSIQKLLIAASSVVVGMSAIASWQAVKAGQTFIPVAQTTNQQTTAAGLAVQLKKIGAKMYGAYWCPHCTQQKEMFGQALSQINYIECDPRGKNPQPNLCQKAGIQAYPTWEINGKLYPGVMSLQDLAKLSGYQN
ncbi:MAG: hypothetical protein KME35_05965 [Aphanocapsa sp. GSE-SYN-MK-11-07L]|jgi:protein-disulfide isomerase|nr:hypothetical protein [Aphanocapsa sp. GSE-SYN-MK-11-07L]